ncbi:MAG TPA: imidazoleglycerol-phosphate dehydratase HisB, partial [Cytophagaceae bacterium]|nr:imidazoleglycerol-phosphate dehydratase HisB [Cytophagaceae bacterium]
DRQTDVKMAENLKCKAILISSDKTQVVPALCELITNDWDEIYRFLSTPSRKAEVKRITKETDIFIELNLDGTGKTNIDTGIAFFDHMLDQLGKHSFSDLTIKVKGDLHIDEHHTIEDTAIALGEAYLKAIGDKKGIERYGWLLPMDDCLAQVAIDFSGRPWIVWEAEFKREKIGEMPTEMFYHFFKSFSDAAKCNLNIKAEGTNEHHKIEAIFKGLAKAIKMAVRVDETNAHVLPSTKGVL